MKIHLIRHAKSSWSDWSLRDFDRPLNKRGKRDAPFMAQKLRSLEKNLDIIYASSSRRTRDTSVHFISEFGNVEVVYMDDLYHASPDGIVEIIRQIPNQYAEVAIIAHNPGITSAACRLPGFCTDNVPTTGIVTINYEKPKEWTDFNFELCSFDRFLYPKLYK